MTYTTSQVESAFEHLFDEESNEDYIEGWDELDYVGEDDLVLDFDGEKVPFQVLVADTGGEGHGEHCEIVVKVGEQYFRKTGYYASHYGTDWDGDFDEVEPYEKTVTFYRRRTV